MLLSLLSASVYFDGEPWDVLATAIEVNKTMPFSSILTIAVTGLEMNCGVSNIKKKNW